MKKWWQQVNRGLLLLALAVLAVSVYLIIDGAQTKKDKVAIKEIAEKFIPESSVYLTCPSGFDFWLQDELDKDSLVSSMSAQVKPLESYYCDNEAVRNSQIDYYFPYFSACRENQICPANCTRKALSVDISEIYNGSATVYVSTQTTVEYKKEDEALLSEVYTCDEILYFLKQEDGWKLVSVQSNMPYLER